MQAIKQKKMCYFCVKQAEITVNDPLTLRRFISSYKKIAPRRRSSLCAKHQRKVARTVKAARIAGLLPFVAE